MLKILSFIIPAILAAIGLRFYIVKQLENPEHHKLPETTNAIILGHSQPECALNDSLIQGVRNFAQGGEAYLYTYAKLTHLLKINPHIQKVYVSFSNNQLEEKMSQWTFDDEYIQDKYSKYFFVMPREEKQLLFKQNPKAVFSTEMNIIKNNSIALVRHKGKLGKQYWGEYLHLEGEKIDSLIKVNYIDTIKETQTPEISEVNLTYLKKIVKLCQTAGKEVIFFRTPIHETLRDIYDEDVFQSFRKKYFSEIPFFDFAAYPLLDNEFRDFDHLNYKGANKFSEYFNENINSNPDRTLK
ncbi:MAG TPA: hypothetical protein VLZ72_02595 [Flavobacterium sp.]|nr:hypothetical protein [Flavobacterium sp.]